MNARRGAALRARLAAGETVLPELTDLGFRLVGLDEIGELDVRCRSD